MPERRWQFNEDDAEYHPIGGQESPAAVDDVLRGSDSDQIVTVLMMPTGEITDVRITQNWRDTIRPDDLGGHIVSATSAATLAALSRQVQQAQQQQQNQRGPQAGSGAVHESTSDQVRRDPTQVADELNRLADDALVELAGFQNHVATAIAGKVVTADSAGGHVEAAGGRGQISRVTLDPRWAHVARSTEIENEVTDALRRVQARLVPAELAQGPHGPAIARLQQLISDPATMLRQLGLVP